MFWSEEMYNMYCLTLSGNDAIKTIWEGKKLVTAAGLCYSWVHQPALYQHLSLIAPFNDKENKQKDRQTPLIKYL